MDIGIVLLFCLYRKNGKVETEVKHPGYRALTYEERAVLEGEKALREDYQRRNPHSDPYWAVKRYYRDSACPWMYGMDTVRGKRYQRGEDRVRDAAVRGDVILRYRVLTA